MSLIFLGRRSPPGCKSEYLPFQTNAPLPVSGVRLQGAIRVLLYKSQGGLCRETRVSHFLKEVRSKKINEETMAGDSGDDLFADCTTGTDDRPRGALKEKRARP